MTEDKTTAEPKKIQAQLEAHLKLLSLSFMQENFEPLADQAARKEWGHVDYLAALAEGEAALRHDRSIERKIRLARFPVIKTLEQFYNVPRKLDREVRWKFRSDPS